MKADQRKEIDEQARYLIHLYLADEIEERTAKQVWDKLEALHLEKALLLLRTLPCSYEDFVDEIVDGKDTISLDEVKSSLLKISSTESSSQFRSRSRKGEVVCWNCGKIGHVRRNCDE
ncbi:hypothetical protein H5410_029036 [Solanum commersonii]|uniref:CCHC-type domain-containing protein n=1 Tax=Solanum commersonii TaxID=4109 RepID=A0A9J5Z6H7_SOLCO|nr:hypothetical protein H5410_029036 [Solanum commersonii]